VVSESVDFLSRKYVPDTTAPAIMTGEESRTVPAPVMAAPINSVVGYDEPVQEYQQCDKHQAYCYTGISLPIMISPDIKNNKGKGYESLPFISAP